jgi:hypothetical protein
MERVGQSRRKQDEPDDRREAPLLSQFARVEGEYRRDPDKSDRRGLEVGECTVHD